MRLEQRRLRSSPQERKRERIERIYKEIFKFRFAFAPPLHGSLLLMNQMGRLPRNFYYNSIYRATLSLSLSMLGMPGIRS